MNVRTVSDTSPSRSRRGTIKANLIVLAGLELSKLEILVGRREADLTAARCRDHAVFAQVSRLRVVQWARHGPNECSTVLYCALLYDQGNNSQAHIVKIYDLLMYGIPLSLSVYLVASQRERRQVPTVG